MGEIGVPVAGLVIARRLSLILTNECSGYHTRSERSRVVLSDLALGLSFPIAQLIICATPPRFSSPSAYRLTTDRLVCSRT